MVFQCVSQTVTTVPVRFAGSGHLASELPGIIKDWNPINAAVHEDEASNKIRHDVALVRIFVFPRNAPAYIPGLRVPPLGRIEASTKSHALYDLTFSSGSLVIGGTSDTDFYRDQRVHSATCLLMFCGGSFIDRQNPFWGGMILNKMYVKG